MTKPEGHKYPHKMKKDWNLLGQGKSTETLKKNMKGKWTIKWNEELNEFEEIEGEFGDGTNTGYGDDWNISSKSKGDLDYLKERRMKYKDYFKYLKEDNQLKGGVGDTTASSDVDPIELSMGIQVEAEHTNDVNIATEIALDHLTENPHYYTKLIQAGLTDELKLTSSSGHGDPTSTFNQQSRLGNAVTCSPGNNIVGTIGNTPNGQVGGKRDSKPILNKTIDVDVDEPQTNI